MRIHLNGVRFRSLFLIAISLPSAILAWFAGQIWLAAHYYHSSNPALWLKAASLEPGNAAYWERLGLYEQGDLRNGDLGKAATYLEQATKANPGFDQFWMELASVYESIGEEVRAKQSYEKAQLAHPISADVAWRYGSFLLRQGDVTSGFTQIRRALTTTPALTSTAIAECWKASPNIDLILNSALPARAEYYVPAINFLLGEGQFDSALAVWKRLLTLKQTIDMAQAAPLTNALIGQNRVPEAQQAWQQALELTEWPQQKNDNGSVVFNGGFEYQPANAGFDWQAQRVQGVSYAPDTSVVHSGKQSMRIVFDGSSNLDFMYLQYIPVRPRHLYHFSAYLRTDSITTDSGLRFLISDPFHPDKVQLLTPNIVGTNPWTLVNADIMTDSDTDLVVIALRRIPSWKFDNKLSGTAWVDDVELVSEADVPKGSSR